VNVMQRTQGGHDQRGQAMVELGICLVLFLMLALGIVEFGRVLMISNVITNAGRQGARAGAVIPPSGRTNGIFTNASETNIQTIVRTEMQSAMSSSSANGFGVVVDQPTLSGLNMVRVRVTGSIPYLFGPFLFRSSGGPTALTVDRTIVFRDEGR